MPKHDLLFIWCAISIIIGLSSISSKTLEAPPPPLPPPTSPPTSPPPPPSFPGSSDRILDPLPGVPFSLSSAHYSGYLESVNGTRLFYWFIESQSSKPSKDPLLLWLNGGPGCSSLFGALGEIGPIRIAPNGSITQNAFSWNAKANLLFLETPAGTGFSHQPGALNYTTNDAETVQINFAALRSFFTKFPHLAVNPFFIAGESYASHYISQLGAHALSQKYPPGFRGIAIGNGRLNAQYESVLFYHYIVKFRGFGNYSNEPSPEYSRPIWVYNALAPECTSIMPHSHIYVRDSAQNSNSTRNSTTESPPTIGPCASDEAIDEWINQPAVRSALHVDPNFNRTWTLCSFDKTYFSYAKTEESLAPLMRKLSKGGIRVLIYSGDADMVCHYLSAKKFVDTLTYSEIGERSNLVVDNRTVGRINSFTGDLTLIRFKDAGHMVPVDAPEASLKMLNEILLV